MPLQWRNQIWQSLEEGAGKRCSECDQYPNHTECADRVGGRLRGVKECPFSGVTKPGRVWRKVPESGARSVPPTLDDHCSVRRERPDCAGTAGPVSFQCRLSDPLVSDIVQSVSTAPLSSSGYGCPGRLEAEWY